MIYPILMKTSKDVERVNEIAARSELDMYIRCGSMAIDPRSILGLFAFIGKDALLVAPDDTNPDYFTYLIRKMSVSA
jgi:hypothetical protein